MINKRTPIRPAHFDHVKGYVASGNVILGGAHSDIKSATIVFKAPDQSMVSKFAETDPYVTNGLVTSMKFPSIKFITFFFRMGCC